MSFSTSSFRQFEFAKDDELLDQMIDVFAKRFAQPNELASPPEG
jgi:hypothetical protein